MPLTSGSLMKAAGEGCGSPVAGVIGDEEAFLLRVIEETEAAVVGLTAVAPSPGSRMVNPSKSSIARMPPPLGSFA